MEIKLGLMRKYKGCLILEKYVNVIIILINLNRRIKLNRWVELFVKIKNLLIVN